MTLFISAIGWLVLIFLLWGLNHVRETLRDNPEPAPSTGEWRRLRVHPTKVDGGVPYRVVFEYRLGQGPWIKHTLLAARHCSKVVLQEAVEAVIVAALHAGHLTQRVDKGKITHDYRP